MAPSKEVEPEPDSEMSPAKPVLILQPNFHDFSAGSNATCHMVSLLDPTFVMLAAVEIQIEVPQILVASTLR